MPPPASTSPTSEADDKERARRERKREIDRRSQRVVRDRKRARIEQLERLVQDLTASASAASAGAGDANTATLAQRVRDQQEQISALNEALQKIVGLANSANGGASASPDVQAESPAVPAPLVAASGQQGEDAPAQLASRPLFMGYSLDGTSDLDRNLFRIMNHILRYIETQGLLASAQHSETVDEDIIVRSLVHGWPAVNERYPQLDVGWKYLQALEAGMLQVAGPVERAAGMYLFRLVMRSKTGILGKGAPARLPSFLDKSYVQQSLPYDSIVDYFAWPQFRDQLILMGVQNIPARDVVDYLASTRFYWPYEFRDIYMKALPSGEFCFSDAFKRHFNDLRCWRLTADFIARFPGLHDVPTDGEVSLAGAPATLHNDDLGLPLNNDTMASLGAGHLSSQPDAHFG